jgi:hypothetical protein
MKYYYRYVCPDSELGGRGQFPLEFVGDEPFEIPCTQLSYISQAPTQHTSVCMHSASAMKRILFVAH